MAHGLSRLKMKFTQQVFSRFRRQYSLNYGGQGVINFIDIGSVGGLPEMWQKNADKIRFLLNFEPNEAATRGPNTLTYNTAIWERDEVLPFYIYKGFKGTGSSLFRQNVEYVRSNFDTLKLRGPATLANSWFDRSTLIDTRLVKCRALDGVLKEEMPATPFNFIKVDAQGAELNILRGAVELLASSCIGLHLELFEIPLYEDIALLDDVRRFLKNYGFELAIKFPAHGTFNSQHDCLFLKNSGDAGVLSLIRKVYGLNP